MIRNISPGTLTIVLDSGRIVVPAGESAEVDEETEAELAAGSLWEKQAKGRRADAPVSEPDPALSGENKE